MIYKYNPLIRSNLDEVSELASVDIIAVDAVENRMVKFGPGATTLINSSLYDDGVTISVDNTKYFTSGGGTSKLDLQETYIDFNTAADYSKSYFYGDLSSTYVYFGTNGLYIDDDIIKLEANSSRIILGTASNYAGLQTSGLTILTDNVNQHTQQSVDKDTPIFINTKNATSKAGVINSVAIAGDNLFINSNNTLYTQQIGYGTDGLSETLVSFTTPTGTRSIVFPDTSGTIALTSDLSTYLLLSGGNMTGSINLANYALNISGTGTSYLQYITGSTSLILANSTASSFLQLFDSGNVSLNGTSLLLQSGAVTKVTIDATNSTFDSNIILSSGKTLTLGNSATTGLVAGALAGATNASITIKDSTGQTYRIPCII